MNIIFNNPAETLGAMRQDPVTALAVASAAMGAVGAIQQGNAAKAQADYQATIAEQNAEISKQQTQAAVERQDRERRIRLGSNIAGAGASGVGLESFGDILSSSAAQEELDLLTLKSEGLLQQRNFMAESSLLKTKGKQAQTAGYMTAASEVLGGASSLYKPSGPKTYSGSGNYDPSKTLPPRKPTRYS